MSFLAANDVENLVFTVIVAVAMGIGGIISAAKKKQKSEEQRRRTRGNWERIEQEMRQRAAQAQAALSQPPGAPRAYAPPPLPPAPPAPVFAPTRSIEGPYVPPRPQQNRQQAPRPVHTQRPAPRPMNRPQVRRQKQQNQPRPAPTMAKAAAALPAAPPIVARRAETPPVPTAGRAPSGADAAALSRWLNPKTLRSQFILTEILQPPLALRDRAEHV
jgi:hypothetical protein